MVDENILPRMLELVRSGKVSTPSHLAKALNISEGMVEAMLDLLERKNYLKTLSCKRSDRCATCMLSSRCRPTRCI